MQKFQDQAEIISLPCPGLVEFVERGELSGEALEHFLKNLFAPYQEKKWMQLFLVARIIHWCVRRFRKYSAPG